MNCADAERLFDSYLDSQLGGSLRLEFDAHRLRCRPCQQSLALVEAVEHVVATDNGTPALSDDFTVRVMAQVRKPKWRFPELRATRVAIVTGALLQAAAVLLLAIWLPAERGIPGNVRPENVDIEAYSPDVLVQYIHNRVDFLRAAHASVASDLGQLARLPRAMDASDDVFTSLANLTGLNPWSAFFLEALAPDSSAESESAPPSADHVRL